MLLVPYHQHAPRIAPGAVADASAAVIGRAHLGANLHLEALATLRADGLDLHAGEDCWFGEASTVHADAGAPVRIGRHVTVGRYALLHTCTIGDGCVVGEGAVLMDECEVGAGAVIAAGSVVTPGKKLDAGWLYAGVPARPVHAITAGIREDWHHALRTARDPHVEAGSASVWAAEPITAVLISPGAGVEAHQGGNVYVAPTASLSGKVVLSPESSVWFGCVLEAGDGRIELGEGLNVQDNSRLHAGPGNELIRIGRRTTLGHNVRMRACEIGDDVMIGMGSVIGEGTVVKDGGCVAAGAVTEPGTVVEGGWIWAGRPAKKLRSISAANARDFRRAAQVYIEHTREYLKQAEQDALRQTGP